MIMARIELETGRGAVAVLYDGRAHAHRADWPTALPVGEPPRDGDWQWTTTGDRPRPYRRVSSPVGGGELVPYDGSVRFHARFGGRTYYRSRAPGLRDRAPLRRHD